MCIMTIRDDGRVLLSGSRDGALRMLDLRKNNVISESVGSHSDAIVVQCSSAGWISLR